MQTFDITGNATTKDGVEIPIKITVEYPDNQGLIAWQMFQHAAENNFEEFVQGMISNGDMSVIEALSRRGYEAEYEEVGEDD